MALSVTEIQAEITRYTAFRNMNEGQITKAIKNLDRLKANQLRVVTKLKSLHAAKINISKFNKVD